ncbi:MAG: hypothetical protein LBJ72_08800 [Dysgonamonadaceae bacterium]|nr:hypothetical protein [Dysgonamonadaceae bacterium]
MAARSMGYNNLPPSVHCPVAMSYVCPFCKGQGTYFPSPTVASLAYTPMGMSANFL